MRVLPALGLLVLALAAAGTAAGERSAAKMTHLVSVIDTHDFGSEQMRIGDLNGDGAPDLLFVQSIYGTREITCLTATTITGEVLWQWGKASPENGRLYSDLPAQIYDWDGDGRNEVLFVKQARYAEVDDPKSHVRERARRYEGDATMVILDALTGKEKGSFALPAPADDCFLFADLTGYGRRRDLVVKDRYWNAWGVSHEAKVLWHWEGSTGHFPAIADLDGDGCDETFFGYALIDQDGKRLFEKPSQGAHQDACLITRLPGGEWRLLFGNGGIHCLTPDGTELWKQSLAEAQHVVSGRFRPDLGPVQLMVIDRGQPRPDGGRHPATLYLYDLEGREVWKRVQPEGSHYAAEVEIDWSGHGEAREVLVYNRGEAEPAAIYDGQGNVVDILRPAYPPEREADGRKAGFYCLRADVWGDSREEVLFFGSRGASIWANARPRQIPTLYNNTLYPGM